MNKDIRLTFLKRRHRSCRGGHARGVQGRCDEAGRRALRLGGMVLRSWVIGSLVGKLPMELELDCCINEELLHRARSARCALSPFLWGLRAIGCSPRTGERGSGY